MQEKIYCGYCNKEMPDTRPQEEIEYFNMHDFIYTYIHEGWDVWFRTCNFSCDDIKCNKKATNENIKEEERINKMMENRAPMTSGLNNARL